MWGRGHTPVRQLFRCLGNVRKLESREISVAASKNLQPFVEDARAGRVTEIWRRQEGIACDSAFRFTETRSRPWTGFLGGNEQSLKDFSFGRGFTTDSGDGESEAEKQVGEQDGDAVIPKQVGVEGGEILMEATNVTDGGTAAEFAEAVMAEGGTEEGDKSAPRMAPEDFLGIPEAQVRSKDEEALRMLEEELSKSVQSFREARAHPAKIYVHIKSFEKIRPGQLSKVRSCGLPARRSLFTVNRSPHVDKKARDQFEMKVHKHLLVIETETHRLREKLSQLKTHDLPGVELKVTFHYQTRLDSTLLA